MSRISDIARVEVTITAGRKKYKWITSSTCDTENVSVQILTDLFVGDHLYWDWLSHARTELLDLVGQRYISNLYVPIR